MFFGVDDWFSGVIWCVCVNLFCDWLFDIIVMFGVMFIMCNVGVSVCVSCIVVVDSVVFDSVYERKFGFRLLSFWLSRLMMMLWFWVLLVVSVWCSLCDSSSGVVMLVCMCVLSDV